MQMESTLPIKQNIFRKKKTFSKNRLILFGMALPFITMILVFNYIPLFGWIYALYDYKLGVPLIKSEFVGLKYFILAVSESGGLLPVLRNTLVLSFLAILCSPIPVVFAILISEAKSNIFKKLVQTTTTFPFFISWIIMFAIVFEMFSIEGFINQVAVKLGFVEEGYNYLGTSSIAWYFQTALGVWKNLGWNAIIYLAAIAGIDQELYDSARVDGAGRFRSILHITIPGIMPTFVVLLLLNIAGMLSNGFEQYFLFYNPLVADKLEVLDYYVYRVGLGNFDYSYSTTLGIFKTVVSVILLFFCNYLSKIIRGQNIV